MVVGLGLFRVTAAEVAYLCLQYLYEPPQHPKQSKTEL